MRLYELTLCHDNGRAKIRVPARNVKQAYERVCNLEGCPERAIQSWRVIPTKKQLAKTKTLMRSL